VQRYRARLSGPLLDRIDLHLPVQRVKAADLLSAAGPNTSVPSTATVAVAVAQARARQFERQGCLNSRLDAAALVSGDALGSQVLATLVRVAERDGLSARGSHRILRVARSIADLEGAVRVETPHLGAALSFRTLS
jgi:magnesium chelatase family protein